MRALVDCQIIVEDFDAVLLFLFSTMNVSDIDRLLSEFCILNEERRWYSLFFSQMNESEMKCRIGFTGKSQLMVPVVDSLAQESSSGLFLS